MEVNFNIIFVSQDAHEHPWFLAFGSYTFEIYLLRPDDVVKISLWLLWGSYASDYHFQESGSLSSLRHGSMEAWRDGGFACLHANIHLKRKEKLGYSFQTIRPEKYAFH